MNVTNFEAVLSTEHLVAIREQLILSVEESRTELARLKAKISVMEERLQLVSRLIEVDARAEADPVDNDPSNQVITDPGAPKTFVGSEDDLETEVEQILETNGKPMHIADIRSELLSRGFPIPGRGDDANIIVRLRKDGSRFTRTARGTYGLPKWGIPTIDRPRSLQTRGRK